MLPKTNRRIIPFFELSGLSEPEEWATIKINGNETHFEVSNMGRLRSLYWGKRLVLMSPQIWDGYKKAVLKINGKNITRRVGRLVAQTFLDNPLNLPEVNHKNLDKLDDRACNLEWSTKANNTAHAGKHGRLNRGNRKLPPKQVAKVFDGNIIKTYPSLGRVKEDGYPRISVTRAANSGKEYNGFNWKYV